MQTELRYDEWHAALTVDEKSDTPWHRMVKSRLASKGALAGKRVLEIGCGRGGFALWLATRNPRPKELVAADFSPTAVRMGQAAAEKFGCSINWQVSDLTKLPFATCSFDTVISCETIEHLSQIRVGVRELARVLKPGGSLMLTTPNYLNGMGLYRAYMRLSGRRFTEEGQPINRFMLLPVTRNLISRSGLKIESVQSVGHYLPFPGRPPIRIHALDGMLTKWFGHHSFVIARKPL